MSIILQGGCQEVSARSECGAIECDDCENISARTTVGSITITNSRGAIQTSTTCGHVSINGERVRQAFPFN